MLLDVMIDPTQICENVTKSPVLSTEVIKGYSAIVVGVPPTILCSALVTAAAKQLKNN